MPRRPSVLLLSILVHAIVLIVIASADLRRPITDWPMPHRVWAFVEDTPRIVRLDDIPLPHESRHAAPSNVSGAPAKTEAAPVVQPDVVAPEVDRQETIGLSFGVPGPIESLVGGPEGGIPPPPPVVLPPPQPKGPLRHSGIRPPERVVHVAPDYPLAARSARKEGLVIIEATIDEKGNVTDARILRSIPLLDEAALAAVRQWKFSPTLLNGAPVAIVMTVTVNFKLTQ